MIDADAGSQFARFARTVNDRHVRKGEAVVLVIEGQECERGVLVLHVGVEDGLVPIDHLIEAPRHIDDVSELRRFCHNVGVPSPLGES